MLKPKEANIKIKNKPPALKSSYNKRKVSKDYYNPFPKLIDCSSL